MTIKLLKTAKIRTLSQEVTPRPPPPAPTMCDAWLASLKSVKDKQVVFGQLARFSSRPPDQRMGQIRGTTVHPLNRNPPPSAEMKQDGLHVTQHFLVTRHMKRICVLRWTKSGSG